MCDYCYLYHIQISSERCLCAKIKIVYNDVLTEITEQLVCTVYDFIHVKLQ